MPLNKSTEAKNAACNAIVDMIDDGSSMPYGTLRIFDSSSNLISSLRLSNPAFNDAIDGTSTVDFIYDSTAVADGTASEFGFYNRDSTWIWGGDITLPGNGGVMELSSLSIPTDTTISISSPVRYIVP